MHLFETEGVCVSFGFYIYKDISYFVHFAFIEKEFWEDIGSCKNHAFRNVFD